MQGRGHQTVADLGPDTLASVDQDRARPTPGVHTHDRARVGRRHGRDRERRRVGRPYEAHRDDGFEVDVRDAAAVRPVHGETVEPVEVVADHHQAAVGREARTQVVVGLLDQRRPRAVAVQPQDRVELTVVVGHQHQGGVVGRPARDVVVGVLVRVGRLARTGAVGDHDGRRARLQADHRHRDRLLVVRDLGARDVPAAVVDDPLLTRRQVAYDDVHVDVVAAVGAVHDRGRGHVEEGVEMRRTPSHLASQLASVSLRSFRSGWRRIGRVLARSRAARAGSSRHHPGRARPRPGDDPGRSVRDSERVGRSAAYVPRPSRSRRAADCPGRPVPPGPGRRRRGRGPPRCGCRGARGRGPRRRSRGEVRPWPAGGLSGG